MNAIIWLPSGPDSYAARNNAFSLTKSNGKWTVRDGRGKALFTGSKAAAMRYDPNAR